MTNAEREASRKVQLVQAAADALMADGAFDAVVVLATWQTEDGDTAADSATRGNYYAQNGLVEYFAGKRKQAAAIEAMEQHEGREP